MDRERHAYIKSGYLHDDYRIFHLRDHPGKTFEYHYHDFHKVLFLLNGYLNYYVEGCCYEMQPGDVILIPSGEVHRPELKQNSIYERMIFYISPDFAPEEKEPSSKSLLELFDHCRRSNTYLLRPDQSLHRTLTHILAELTESVDAGDGEQFAASLYQRIKLIEILIELNRGCLKEKQVFVDPVTANPVILKALAYIQDHMDDPDLDVDQIAESLFVSRSYLMHLFKAESGYSIGNYLAEKRLYFMKMYRKKGLSIQDALEKSGFKNYAAFYYAKTHIRHKDRLSEKTNTYNLSSK